VQATIVIVSCVSSFLWFYFGGKANHTWSIGGHENTLVMFAVIVIYAILASIIGLLLRPTNFVNPPCVDGKRNYTIFLLLDIGMPMIFLGMAASMR